MAPYRLQRLDWLFSERPMYFVTACTHERRPLLADPTLHQAFIEFSRQAEPRRVYVGRYVLMPDHLHLFAALGQDAPTLPNWIKSLKNGLSKTLMARSVESPHWQKGFFDHVLRSQESYAEKLDYVRLNPVRAGLATRAEDWPFQGEICHLEF